MIFNDSDLSSEERGKLKKKAGLTEMARSLLRSFRFTKKLHSTDQTEWQNGASRVIVQDDDKKLHQTRLDNSPISNRISRAKQDEKDAQDIRRMAWEQAGGDPTSTPVDAEIILDRANKKRREKGLPIHFTDRFRNEVGV